MNHFSSGCSAIRRWCPDWGRERINLIGSNRSQGIVAGFARFQGGFFTPTARKKAALASRVRFQGGIEKIPAITDFRAKALSWARRA